MKFTTLATGLLWLFENGGKVETQKDDLGLIIKFKVYKQPSNEVFHSTVGISNEQLLLKDTKQIEYLLTIALVELERLYNGNQD